MFHWKEDKIIEFVWLENNVGFAKANNIGLSLVSDYDHIALINPDATLDSCWHEEMLKIIERYHNTASFASVLMMEYERAYWDGLGDIYHISGLAWRDGHGYHANFDELVEREIFSPCAAAAVYRRKSLVEVGGFDDDYFCYLEDVDLGFRLRLKGYDSMLVPKAIAYHVGSASTGGKHSDFAVYHGHRNLVWTFVKDMPGVMFWLLLPMHIMMNLAALVRFSLSGQASVIFKAKWDAIKGLPEIIRKRHLVQSSRKCSIGKIWRMLDKRLFIRK